MRFRLEIDGVTLARFRELVMGAGAEERAGHPRRPDPTRTKRRAGVAQARNVTLKGGITDSHQLSTWYARASSGSPSGTRQKVVIVEVDQKGNDVARYVVTNGLPVKLDSVELKAGGNEVAVESLELSSDGIELVP